MSNGKTMIILLTVGLIKKISLYKMSYSSEPYTPSKSKINVELYLSVYATKAGLKSGTDLDTSDFTKKTDLTSLKLDIVKLESNPADLSKLKNLIYKEVAKITI